MADNVGEWSPTAGSNTSLGAVSLLENVMLVNAVNNAFREMMAQLATGISANAMMAAYAPATASGAAYIDFKEDTDNGTNRVRLQGPASTADVTVTLPAEAGTLGVVIDEDDMVSDSATKAPSQQSVKAYVDALPGGVWEHISTSTPAAVASLDITGLSAYRMLRITGTLYPVDDNVVVNIRTDTANGASFDVGASDYAWLMDRGTGTTPSAVEDTADTKMRITTGVGNATGEDAAFEIIITNLNQARYTYVSCRFAITTDTGAMYTGTSMGRRLNAAADNAIQFLFETGNIAGGFVVVEGVLG